MAYTNIEYADIVFMLSLADGNGNLAARLWAERFPQRRVPRPNTFLTTYRRLRETAVFTKDGIFNQYNLHLWSEENPHAIRIRGSQYKFSINIWCGLVGNTLLGPHELPARLNGQGFLYFIMHHLPILLENVPLEEQETMWFMLDGAPPHHTNAVRQQLHYLFPDKIIGREAGNNAQYR
ncbi:hypothetical protein QTP88_018825 [Uroleucon formosanum]